MIGAAAALVLAAGDWVAVARGARGWEAALKSLVPPPLIGVALATHDWWFAAALALCLAGDVLLLPQVDRFRAGLAAFLLGHLAFIAAFLTQPLRAGRIVLALPVLVLVALVAPRLVPAVPRSLRAPVIAYMTVIVAMFASSVLVSPLAAIGAGCFVASDTLLAWNRFVRPLPSGRVGVMVTYHLALVLLTLALLY